jgi:hypothetical protein
MRTKKSKTETRKTKRVNRVTRNKIKGGSFFRKNLHSTSNNKWSTTWNNNGASNNNSNGGGIKNIVRGNRQVRPFIGNSFSPREPNNTGRGQQAKYNDPYKLYEKYEPRM